MDEKVKKILDKAHKYIFELGMCIDDEVFNASTLSELGKYFFTKTIQNISGLTAPLLKAHIKVIELRNKEPACEDDYFKALCEMAFVHQAPQYILSDVRKEFEDIFIDSYERVKTLLSSTLVELDNRIFEVRSLSQEVKNSAESISGGAFIKDITPDYTKLKDLSFELRIIETQKETLEKLGELLSDRMDEYCDLCTECSIELSLRNTAIKLSHEREYTADSAKDEFSLYRSWVDTAEDEVARPYALFFKVKLSPITHALMEEHRKQSYRDDEKALKDFKEKADELPKIDILHQLKIENPESYLSILRAFICKHDVIARVAELIKNSTSMFNRKSILTKMLEMYRCGEYELFANLTPIQTEGIITDFLTDETTFRRFTDLTIYPKATLREKLALLKGFSKYYPPETSLYFSYYFNNIIRNNIAHGVFESLCQNDMHTEILAAELLLDVQYALHIVTIHSETEKMKSFIQGYIEHYKKLIKNYDTPHFGAMFNDLIGRKIVMLNGIPEKYRPIQVIFWVMNPTYEKIYAAVAGDNDLLELRKDVISKPFWEYVLKKLESVVNTGYDYLRINEEFDSIVRGLFSCGIEDELKPLLGKVNTMLTKIRTFE